MNSYDAHREQVQNTYNKNILERLKAAEDRMKQLESYLAKSEVKKPIIRWQWAYRSRLSNEWCICGTFFTDIDAAKNLKDVEHIKLEYTRTEFPE